MAAHSSILAWRNPWKEEPAGYGPWGHKESDKSKRLIQYACQGDLVNIIESCIFPMASVPWISWVSVLMMLNTDTARGRGDHGWPLFPQRNRLRWRLSASWTDAVVMATSSAPRSSRLVGTTALPAKCLHEDSVCSLSMSLPYSYLHQQEKKCSRNEIPVPSCWSSQTEGRSRLCSSKCDSFSAYPQCSSTAHLLMLERPRGPMLTGSDLVLPYEKSQWHSSPQQSWCWLVV